MTMTVVHDHQGRAKDGQEAMLEVRVTYLRRHIFVSTGIKVRRSEWVAGRVTGRMDASVLNERLAIIYNKVGQEVNTIIDNGGQLDAKAIRRKVFSVVQEGRCERPLIEWIVKQIKVLNVSEGTRKHYGSLVNRLDAYGKLVRWQDVTVEGICDFDAWLRSLRSDSENGGAVVFGRLKDGLSDGAVYTYHKCLKALLNRAELYDVIKYNPYRKLKGQFKRGERDNTEYLSEDEVLAIRAAVIPQHTELAAARDLFVFQLYTGLSYSDTQVFDIRQYKKVGDRWRYRGERMKTGVPFVCELLPPAVEVVERYGGKVPIMENHEYNRMLKAVGAMAGVRAKLHSHLARHTFATMMLRCGAKIENVSRMLGHTNIKQTQRYAKVLAQSVYEDIERARERMK